MTEQPEQDIDATEMPVDKVGDQGDIESADELEWDGIDESESEELGE